MIIRKANINDVKKIQQVINNYAEQKKMLPRSLNDIYEHLRDFYVYEDNGSVEGVCALHVVWEDLAEIKAFAVSQKYTGKHIGSKLINTCLEEAKSLGIKKIFCLTYIPDFFKKFAFQVISRDSLPHKVWRECINCPKFPDCDEIAMIREDKN